MMFTSLLAASALASQAVAFLVPLEVAKAAKSIEEDLHLSLIDTKTESIALQCPGCFFDTENDHQEDYASQPENFLALNFTINDADNTLALNGQKFYPIQFPFPLNLFAPLVREANSVASPPIRLGFALEYLPFSATADKEGTVVPIHFSIVDLDGVPIKVPTVAIDLIKLPTRELLIAKVDTIPVEETEGQDCTTAVCRAKAIILGSLRDMIEGAKARAHKAGKMMGMKGKGCGRMRGHRKPGHRVGPDTHGDKTAHHGHHVQGQHRNHHGHRHHSRIHRFIHQLTHLFIIPALLGIVGGLTASAIGMIVGQGIAFLWFRFVRGGHRGTASSARLTETGVEDEKEALVAEETEDGLPSYEESKTLANEDKN